MSKHEVNKKKRLVRKRGRQVNMISIIVRKNASAIFIYLWSVVGVSLMIYKWKVAHYLDCWKEKIMIQLTYEHVDYVVRSEALSSALLLPRKCSERISK